MYFNKKLWIFTEGLRGRISFAVALGVISSALGIARLALLGWLLGLVFQGAPFDELLYAGLGVALAIALRGALEYARVMVAHRTAAMAQLNMRRTLYDKIMELGPAHLGQRRSGDLVVTLVHSIEHLEVYFGKYLPQLFVALITPVLIFAFVAWIDWVVAGIFLAAALVTLVAPAAFHSWDSKNSLARARAYSDFAAEFLDSIQGLATLKAFGQSRARGRLLGEKAAAVFRSTMWVLGTNSLTRGITDTGIALGAAAALAMGAYRVEAGEISLSALLVILLLGIEVFRPLRDLRSLLHEGMLAQAASGKILDLLSSQPEIEESECVAPQKTAPEKTAPEMAGSENRAAATSLPATITFQDVGFAYPGGRGATHQGLSFDVAAGDRIGVVGESGSGKSSIVRLLLRLYDPQQGQILLGGRDLKDMSFDQIRAQLAIVSQDTYLFHGTVEENLRLGKADASQEELEAAARAANAHDFIADLPSGYRTVIGERGMRLSGGQRQRIAIARALLRDAPILILDEALSAVDAENEAVIQKALDRLMEGRTTLILAHRLSSVIDADRILVLGEGRVIEEGDHETLMARKGAYWGLMAEQAQDRGSHTALAPSVRFQQEAAPVFAEELAETPPGTSFNASAVLQAEGLGWPGAIAKLMAYIGPWWGKLALTFGFGVTRVAAFIGVGLVSALGVAAVKNDEPIGAFIVAIFLLAPAAGVLHWFESWIAHDMAFRLLAEMRVELFKKIAKLAPAFLVRRRTGDLVAMATEDVEMVEYFFAHTIAPAFVAVLVPSAAVIVLGVFHWGLSLALLPFLAVVAVSPFILRRRIDRLASKDREALGELNAHSVDSIQGMAEIMAFQQEERRKTAFVSLIDKHHGVRLPFFADLTLQTVLVEVMTTLGGLSVVLLGGYLTVTGTMSATYLPFLTLLAMAAFLPISEIADIGRQLADTLGAVRRLHAVDSEPVPVTDGYLENLEVGREATGKEQQGGLAITFDRVTFRYPGQEEAALNGNVRPALHELSLELAAGSTVALVGPSGAGKTTIAHLLLRFWDPDQGQVKLSGHDLRDYKLDTLRGKVALVAQDTYLFNDTLKANILLAKPEASEAELSAAIDRAALRSFVDGLPQGLETPVGERGMALSGGQRQRVAIARAFLRDAPVLILDEATSSLDATSERLVHQALSDLMRERTTLVIAHRLSTVREADKIAVLDQGRVVEEGRHDELLAKGGLYAHFLGRQLTAGGDVEAAE